MSGFEYQGRKIVDTKPVFKGQSKEFARLSHPADNELTSAWDSVSKAKSVLRRAEFTLREFEQPPLRTEDVHHSVAIDRVPRFHLDDGPADSTRREPIVDQHGRTQYMKAKESESRRKVSRMDGKYTELPARIPEPEMTSQARDPLRESNRLEAPRQDQLRSRMDPGYSRSGYSRNSDNRTEMSGSRSDRYHRYSKGPGEDNRTDMSSGSKDDHMRILNEVNPKESSSSDARPARLTSVNVTVPYSRSAYHPPRYPAMSAPGHPVGVTVTDSSGSGSGSSNPGSNTTYTKAPGGWSQDGGSLNSHKILKALKKIDGSSDALSNMHRLIEQQKQGLENKATTEDLERRKIHHDNEPIAPGGQDLLPGATAPPRKVAQGPPLPVYRGFSEVEHLRHAGDGRRVAPPNEHKAHLQPPPIPPRRAIQTAPSEGSRVRETDSHKQERAKLARVVAPRKVAKPGSDLITTSSWRSGQRAVQRELGVQRLPAMSTSPPSKDPGGGRDKPPPADRDQLQGQPLDTLSKEARGVLDDLQAEHSDKEDGEMREESPDREDEKRREAAARRAKRKRMEREDKDRREQEKRTRVRSYDSSEVRKYINKQRLERRKRQAEEEEAQRRAERERLEHLEQLYKRQREGARSSSRSRGEGGKAEEGGQAPCPRAPHGEESEERAPSTGDSDKENRRAVTFEDGSEAASHPKDDRAASRDRVNPEGRCKPGHDRRPSRPSRRDERRQKPDPEPLIRQYLSGSVPDAHAQAPASHNTRDEGPKPQPQVNGSGVGGSIPQGHVAPPGSLPPEPRSKHGALDPDTHQSAREILKKMQAESGVTTDDLISRFAAQTAAVKATGPSEAQKTRLDRIHAIQNISQQLQSRIQTETSKIAGVGQGRWAFPPHEEPDYIGRYQRMEGTKEPVFDRDSDLPGVRTAGHRHQAEPQSPEIAATKIQAAYRGHSVRQTLGWSSPPQARRAATRGVHRPRPELPDSSASDIDSLGDSTLTDDSIALSPRPRKDWRGSDRRVSPVKPCQPVPRWGESAPDPYSFFNVHNRKNRHFAETARSQRDAALPSMSRDTVSGPISGARESHVVRGADPRQMALTTSRGSSRTHSPSSSVDDTDSTCYKDIATDPKETANHNDPSKSPRASRALGSRSPGSHSDRSRSPHSADISTDLDSSLGLSNTDRTPTRSNKVTDGVEEEGGLDRTLTPSGASDENRTSQVAPSMSLVPSQGGRSSARDAARDSDWSEVSSLTEDSLDHRDRKRNKGGYGYEAGRLPPSVLHHRLGVELTLLEGMEESVRQLTDVERTRAVSLAQQETVSLAQVLKARHQTHTRDMTDLQLRAQRESLDAARQLEAARRQATEATESAANTISQVRAQGALDIQESTRRLIDSQTRAAMATEEAARHLAEVGQSQSRLAASQPSLTESATAAATAAVQATLLQYRPRLGVSHEQATQYSARQNSRSYSGAPSERSVSDVSQSLSSDRRSAKSYSMSSFESATSSRVTAQERGSNGGDVSSEVETAKDLSVASDVSDIKTASEARTASDSSGGRQGARSNSSSIRTESEAKDDVTDSKTVSVSEEIVSEKDYTIEDETVVTEEEMDRSLRDVLPSEGQRKELKRKTSDADFRAISVEDFSLPPVSNSRRLSFEEDSFTRFSVDMVRQYMQEEEVRAQHHSALLRLREKALKDKTKAELAWIQQQKQRCVKRGADESYPPLKKRQRGLIRRLQQEQAEIKRLKEAQELASQERQMLLRQSHEISKMHQSAEQVRQKMRQSGPPGVGRAEGRGAEDEEPTDSTADIPTEDELSLQLDDASETSQTPSPRKADKSDLESPPDRGRPASPYDSRVKQELKKIKMDPRYLTARMKKLAERRRQAERLLQMEEEVKRLEKAALSGKSPATSRRRKKDETVESPDDGRRGVTPRVTPRAEASVTETTASISERPTHTGRSKVSSVAEELTAVSGSGRAVTESIAVSGSSAVTESVSTAVRKGRDQSSESSVVEEDIRTADDTEITSSVQPDYSNATFESTEVTQTRTQTQTQGQTQQTQSPVVSPRGYGSTSAGAVSPAAGSPGQAGSGSRLSRLAKEKGLDLRTVSPKSPTVRQSPNSNNKRGSESESEDSFSLTFSETPSDHSDVENRIRALSEELKRRKLEAERLKREKKKVQKEKQKERETLLKKQIENYDNYISQVKSELQKDGVPQERARSPVRPQIKPPHFAGPTAMGADIERSRLSKELPKSQTSSSSPIDVASSATSRRETETSGEKKSEVSESIQEDELPTTPSGSAAPDRLELRLRLELDDEDEKSALSHKDVVKDTTARGADTARSVSEIPEESVIHTARSDIPEESDLILSDRSEARAPSETSGAPEESGVRAEESEAPQKSEVSRSELEPSIQKSGSEIPEESLVHTSEVPEDSSIQTAKSDSTSKAATPSTIHEKSRDHLPSGSGDGSEDGADKSEKSVSSRSGRSEDRDYSQDTWESSSADSRSGKTSEASRSRTSESSASRTSTTGAKSVISARSDASRESKPEGSGIADKIDRKEEEKAETAKEGEATLKKVGEQNAEVEKKRDVAAEEQKRDEENAEEEEEEDNVYTEDDISEALSEDEAEGESDGEGLRFDLTPEVTAAPLTDPLEGFTPGDRVLVSGLQPATLRYKGAVGFADGVWAGVELDKPEGRNDGKVEGRRYFTCPADHGLFVPPDKLSPLTTEAEEGEAPQRRESASSPDREPGAGDSGAVKSGLVDSAHAQRLQGLLDDLDDELEDLEEDSLSLADQQQQQQQPQQQPLEAEVETEAASSSQKEKAAEVAVNNLLNEAISQMVAIHRGKRASSPDAADRQGSEVTHEAAEVSEKPKLTLDVGHKKETTAAPPSVSPPRSPQAQTPTTPPAPDTPLPPVSRGGGSLLAALGLETPDLASLNGGDLFGPASRRDKKKVKVDQDELDELYKDLESLVDMDDDAWMDDDFGMGRRHPPPPYAATPEGTTEPAMRPKHSAPKRPEEVYLAVPHRPADVVRLSDDAVDVFWERRRYGESWDDQVEAPPTYFRSAESDAGSPGSGSGSELETRSRRVYQRLVFDMVGHVLREMYRDEQEDEDPDADPEGSLQVALVKPRLVRHKYHKNPDPPTTAAALKAIVRQNVLQYLGLPPWEADPERDGSGEGQGPDNDGEDSRQSRQMVDRGRKWSSRKKRDQADQILIQELREEEPDWVNYDKEELDIKMQLADTLFEAVLQDTGRSLGRLLQKRLQRAT